MSINCIYFIGLISFTACVTSCKTLEKASVHGLTSGYYILKTEHTDAQPVYVDVTNDQIEVYHHKKRQPDSKQFLTIPLTTNDSLVVEDLVLKKQSLDVDITSILLKYRPSVRGLPAQFPTDLNVALYVGWRHDTYQLKGKKDPLGKRHQTLSNMGYDVGFFAGPGATIINPFSTTNRRIDEYSGMIIQTGVAGFLESNVASFGISIGVDYLLNPDRRVWIYQQKPWVGFIVGIALN